MKYLKSKKFWRIILISFLIGFIIGCEKDSEEEKLFFEKVSGKYYTRSNDTNKVYQFNKNYLPQEMRFYENSFSCEILGQYKVVSISKEDSNSIEGIVEYFYADGSSFEYPFRLEIRDSRIIGGFDSVQYAELNDFQTNIKLNWINLNEKEGNNDGSCKQLF